MQGDLQTVLTGQPYPSHAILAATVTNTKQLSPEFGTRTKQSRPAEAKVTVHSIHGFIYKFKSSIKMRSHHF